MVYGKLYYCGVWYCSVRYCGVYYCSVWYCSVHYCGVYYCIVCTTALWVLHYHVCCSTTCATLAHAKVSSVLEYHLPMLLQKYELIYL